MIYKAIFKCLKCILMALNEISTKQFFSSLPQDPPIIVHPEKNLFSFSESNECDIAMFFIFIKINIPKFEINISKSFMNENKFKIVIFFPCHPSNLEEFGYFYEKRCRQFSLIYINLKLSILSFQMKNSPNIYIINPL